MPGGLHPHAHADSSPLQFSVELLSFTIAVIQLSFPALPSFLIHKSDLLKARVIIYAYNDHVRLLPPEPLVVMQPQFTRVEGADIVMKSSARHFPETTFEEIRAPAALKVAPFPPTGLLDSKWISAG